MCVARIIRPSLCGEKILDRPLPPPINWVAVISQTVSEEATICGPRVEELGGDPLPSRCCAANLSAERGLEGMRRERS